MKYNDVRGSSSARVSALLWAFSLLLMPGCAGTVRQAAKEAAPAAVEGAIEGADDPETRNDIAGIIADPEIHEASAALAAALTEGVVQGLSDSERTARVQALMDSMVESVGLAMARTVRQDIGPELAMMFAGAVDVALQRALAEQTQERMQEMAQAVSRGMLEGMGEAILDPMTDRPRVALSPALGGLAREVTRQAAFGFEEAVQDARLREGSGERGQVLAAFGALADFALFVPALLVGGLVLVLVLGVAALIWALWRLRHYRRMSQAREAAALSLARAIKETEGAAWSDELRQHVARAARDPSGEELRQLLREHRELDLRPRGEPPRSERSAPLS